MKKSLIIKSRAITAYIVIKTGKYPVIHPFGFEFLAQETELKSVCVCEKSEREWESSYQTANGSLSDFNQLLKSLGDGQRAIRKHSKKDSKNE